jgi:tetratricopeptide (TPR) repeat protein
VPLADDFRYLIEYDILRAQRLLRGLVTEMPRSYEARILLGDSFLRGLEFGPALEQYRSAAAMAPAIRVALMKIALCQLYTGQYEAALAGFEQIQEKGKEDHALALAGLLLHRLGRPAEAVERYQKVVDTGPPNSKDAMFALQGMMFALRDLGRWRESDAAAARLLEHAQQRPDEVPGDLHAFNSSYDHFEWSRIADKGQLAALLARHSGPNQGDRFFPESFIMPEQRVEFVGFAARQPAGTVFIIKPRNGQGGQSISLTDRIDVASNAMNAVVQRYVDQPYLVNGKKAHMRIYGLVTGSDPFRLYVYRDGIVRFTPELYERRTGWLDQSAMHVTNTALHRDHPKLVISNDPDAENAGDIWSLKAYLARLAADGHDADVIFANIARIAGRFVLMLRTDGMFDRQSRKGPARSFVPKLFGMDVLLDKDARPWLIEIQRSPAWGGSPLVKRINRAVATTRLRMAVGRLTPDGKPPGAAMLADPAALAWREREIEEQNRGDFVPVIDSSDLTRSFN